MKVKNSAFSLIELSVVILVIGILIAGVTQGTRMISAYRISTAATMTNSSPVSSIPNLSLWFEPILEGAFINANNISDVSDGDVIQTWKDINIQTSARNDATQSTNSYRPLYRLNGINKLPSLSYDGNDCLFITNNLFGYNYSVFAVAKTSTPTGSNANVGIVSRDIPSFANDSMPIVILNSYAKTSVGTSSADTIVPTASTSRMVDDGVAHIFYNSRYMSTGAVTVYVDGTSVAQGTGSTNALTSNGLTSIGCVNSSVTTNRLTGYIAEVIAFDRVLKNEERQSVEQYLSKKWGIPLS